MSSNNNITTFFNTLAFLQEDQPKIEQFVADNIITGVNHEQLSGMGRIMLNRLLVLAKRGESFLLNLPEGVVPGLTVTINEYLLLFFPKTLCKCVKRTRIGATYDQQLDHAKALVAAGAFVPVSYLIDHKAERINVESVKANELTVRMGEIFSSLSAIQTNGKEAVREKARKDISQAWEAVDRFILIHFDGDDSTFKIEAKRKLRSIKESLQVKKSEKPTTPSSPGQQQQPRTPATLTRRALVACQAGLQEIMNSVASMTLGKSKRSMYKIEDLQNRLVFDHDVLVGHLNKLEEAYSQDEKFHGELQQLLQDSEVVFNDGNSKLRDALKRWTSIKAQSYPRPVAIIEEPVPVLPPAPDPQKVIQSTTKAFNTFGKEGGKIAKEGLQGVKDAVSVVANDFVNVTGTGVTGVMNIASSGASKAINAGNKAVSLPAKAAKDLFGDSSNGSNGSNPNNSKPSSSSSFMPNLKPFNLLDM